MTRHTLTSFILLTFICVTAGVWHAEYTQTNRGVLTVAFLDVGQGDSIFIQSPTGQQVLIDGGPDKSVLRQLATVMPFYDRSIDVVIATHPDSDHISGLVDVLQRYAVSLIMRPGVQHDTPATNSLLLAAAQEEEGGDAREVFARRGQVLDLGGGAYLHILFPDRDATNLETNMASIVARLTYGDTSVLLTGDSPSEIEEYLVSLDGTDLKSDILKLGHHGSKTSSGDLFLGYVDPQWGVISVGADNRYGHPHQEVLDTLERFGIATKNTAEGGSVIFESVGTGWVLR